jgi:hypothetical protein
MFFDCSWPARRLLVAGSSIVREDPRTAKVRVDARPAGLSSLTTQMTAQQQQYNVRMRARTLASRSRSPHARLALSSRTVHARSPRARLAHGADALAPAARLSSHAHGLLQTHGLDAPRGLSSISFSGLAVSSPPAAAASSSFVTPEHARRIEAVFAERESHMVPRRVPLDANKVYSFGSFGLTSPPRDVAPS